MTVFLKDSNRTLARTYRLALLDLDGVVYRGADPVKNAVTGIVRAETQGMSIFYTTNNASRPQKVVADQLRGFGVTLTEEQIITSAIVAARMIRHCLHPGARVLVIGADHLRVEVRAQGMEVVDSAADKPEAVIQGWDPDLSWNNLAEASYAIDQGARYFATNMDKTIPREGGIAPGNGAMTEPVHIATGKVPEKSAGKPESAMYDEAKELLRGNSAPLTTKDCLPVGDRLDTDIEAANRGGYDSLAVLTGVATVESIILARPEHRPTFIAADLLGLSQPQPGPKKNAGQIWYCGRVGAQIGEGSCQLLVDSGRDRGQGEAGAYDPKTDLDAVRACACAVWEYMDQGHDPSGLSLPEFQIGV